MKWALVLCLLTALPASAAKPRPAPPRHLPPAAISTPPALVNGIDDAGSQRTLNACATVDACIDSILANAGQFDMRNSIEAMWRMQTMRARGNPGFHTSAEWQKQARQSLDRVDALAALEYLRAAIALAPGNEMLQVELGAVLLQKGELADAARAFRAALALVPWRSYAWEGLARVYQAQADYVHAAAALAVAYEWAFNKPAQKAGYLSQSAQTMYQQALQLINRRNEQTLAAWERVRQQGAQLPPGIRQPVLLERAGLNCHAPEYPLQALRKEEQGAVTLQFLLEVDGSVLDTRIEKSSGVADLDAAARLSMAACFGIHPPAGRLPGRVELRSRYEWKLE